MKAIHAKHLYIGTAAEMGGVSPPADAQGTTFFQTDTGAIYYWDGDSWEAFGGSATDANAIHDNVANEITAITEKGSPVGNDELIIEDSEAAGVKKSVKITNLPGGADADAIHDNVAGEIVVITEKTVPVGADEFIIEDSEDSNNKKSLKLSNMPGGTDSDAIHDNVAGEITAITPKGTPVANDEFIIEDSAAGDVKKALTYSSLETAIAAAIVHDDPDAIHDDVANEITAITEKTVVVGNDEILIEDSEASYVKKSVKMSNLPAGSPAADYTFWDPMAPPASPESIDDEFDAESGSGTPGGWTEFNPGGGSHLKFEEERGLRTGGDGTVNIQGFFKTYTMATNAFTGIYTRVACPEQWTDSGSQQKHVGLALFEDATSNPTTCDIWCAWLRWHSSAGLGIQLAHYDDYNSLNTLAVDYSLDVPGPTGVYLMLSYTEFISDFVSVHYSVDGRSWISVGGGQAIAFTPAEVGVAALASGGTYWDFFRGVKPGSITAPDFPQGQRVKRFID